MIVGYRSHARSDDYLIELLECGHERVTSVEPEVNSWTTDDPVSRHCKECPDIPRQLRP